MQLIEGARTIFIRLQSLSLIAYRHSSGFATGLAGNDTSGKKAVGSPGTASNLHKLYDAPKGCSVSVTKCTVPGGESYPLFLYTLVDSCFARSFTVHYFQEILCTKASYFIVLGAALLLEVGDGLDIEQSMNSAVALKLFAEEKQRYIAVSGGEIEGHISALVEVMRPAVIKAQSQSRTDNLLENQS